LKKLDKLVCRRNDEQLLPANERVNESPALKIGKVDCHMNNTFFVAAVD
jgi:hypothetical protein